MTSLKDHDITDHQDISELPPSGTSLHKRRRGEPPASLSVKPQTPSDDGSSPCTAATPDDYWTIHNADTDPEDFCESMIQRLKDREDLASRRGKDLAEKTKDTLGALDQLEKLLELLDQFVTLKEQNSQILRKLKDVEHLKKMHEARQRIRLESEKVRNEELELQQINEALDADLSAEYSQVLLEGMLTGGRSMKRTGSKWKGNSRFRGSLLRKQRSRSAGGEESDATPGTPLRRRSEGIFCKEVDKSKVSKWTRVKAAFRWEKAQWPPTITMGGAAGAVAAGALVGAVALAGSAPSSANSAPTSANSAPTSANESAIPSASGTLTSHGDQMRDLSLTPRSAMSLTPNSSCEELRIEGDCRKSLRCDENDNTFLHAPAQDDSSTSPSPNKMHKTPWSKMRDIIQTRRESVRKKTRGSKRSPDVVPVRRRSFSDGGDSDAPPVLTLTIPSSEELESEPHPLLRKQRSLELSARPPQHRPRASKWSKVKRAFLTSASASMPSSPSRHSAFFTDAETEGLSSGCEASGVKEEIARDYAALQSKLGREFFDRRVKLYANSRPVATEEQLSTDFRKKLAEWQKIKGVRQPPPVPARQDLSDDFLKKWDEWKRMKETNSVPAWEEETQKRDEVLVQTSTGLFKFQGISRSFTRKLHEWEKSRGIAPEASTSALLRAARARVAKQAPQAPLTRTQSDGSVAPSANGSGRHHASSLSVNDADDFDLEYDRENRYNIEQTDDDGDNTRGAVLVEVEAEEVCTAAPLVAVSPRHMPQKPVYTYGRAEARLLCETSSAVTGTAVLQANGKIDVIKDISSKKCKGSSREQSKSTDKIVKRKLGRQVSLEEDAKFIRKTIEEIERSSNRFKNEDEFNAVEKYADFTAEKIIDEAVPSTSKTNKQSGIKEEFTIEDIETQRNTKVERKESDKQNGKKKSKSRARLERELSKPSESDTELDVDTVTVEIPRRRKKPKRPSERPRTPPTSLHSDSGRDGEVFVLKLKAPVPREGSPEIIVKTTRKIFSPVVRSGETVPRAVIPFDVEDLDDVKHHHNLKQRSNTCKEESKTNQERSNDLRSKSSGDLPEVEEQKTRSRPPLPLSPPSQRKPLAKETSPSIRIMIQRYNMKINEEGHTSGASSGASSPAWRSPAAERRRPPDMPVGVNIRNNPFLEREVQKSASACQLSRRDQSTEKRQNPTPPPVPEGVLKSHSANALLLDKPDEDPEPIEEKTENRTEDQATSHAEDQAKASQDISNYTTASTDTIVPDLTKNLPVFTNLPKTETQSVPYLRQISYTSPTPIVSDNPGLFERSISVVEAPIQEVTRMSERTARIRAARERFLSTPSQIRREGTSSASDLRPGDRSSRISCESDVTETRGSRSSNEEVTLGRSASTGMVNVDREAWERVAEDRRGRGRSSRSRFSLARLAAKLRRKDEGVVSRLCRQSLLVQLRNKQ